MKHTLATLDVVPSAAAATAAPEPTLAFELERTRKGRWLWVWKVDGVVRLRSRFAVHSRRAAQNQYEALQQAVRDGRVAQEEGGRLVWVGPKPNLLAGVEQIRAEE